jgi:hypothetical protein
MSFNLQRAAKSKLKLRIALSAPSGGGKTYSAILLAQGIATAPDRIAVIDTENGSANYYAHLCDYNVVPFDPEYSPARYVEAIKACEKAGMEVIVIDSLSHVWVGKGGILEIKDRMPGNDFAKWAQLTPLYQSVLDAMLHSKCHIIATMRSKQDHVLTVNEKGKTEVQKMGLAPQMRDGIDYEFGVVFDVNIQNYAQAGKDRTGIFKARPPFRIDADTGRELLTWADQGEALPEPPPAWDKDRAVGLGNLLNDTLSGVDQPTADSMKADFKKAFIAKDMARCEMLVATADTLLQLANPQQQAA